jgi:FkbH-like protein
VFFDDNPVERAWVKDQLPEVLVVDVPKQPLDYASVLEAHGRFELLRLTDEDLKRAELYAQEESRNRLRTEVASPDDFLHSLEMRLTLGDIDATTLPRVAQMLAKTNQFNLTTRRHSAADLQAMLDAGAVGIWARLQDRFGDNGYVAAALAVQGAEGQWCIDSLLMSCRVIGRQVETALLATVEERVRQRGAQTLLGEYLPTAKNQPAASFFSEHGYEDVDGTGTQWRLTLADRRDIPPFFTTDPSAL